MTSNTPLDTSPKAINHHIFHTTYLYAIPGYYRYSKEYNSKVGHLSTGDRQEDIRALNEYVNVGGTIADILKLFEQGADIRFQNTMDLVTIYEVLVAHLRNWNHHIETDPNISNAPIQSLNLMTEFAESIKPTVIGYKPKAADVPMMRKVNSIFGNLGGAEILFKDVGMGTEVQETAPVVSRIEKLMAERNKNKLR